MTDMQTDDMRAEAVSTDARPGRRRWGRWMLGTLLALVAWNGTVTVPVASALSGEQHTTIVYRRWLVSPSEIVFDVWSVKPTGSMADMDRQLFKTADALKGRQFSNVVLAYHGSGRFKLGGAHFKEIGESWDYQNPVYLVRTLTENVSDMDGKPAFGTWTGGWLGVIGKQFEDHNELHRQWYLRPSMGLSS